MIEKPTLSALKRAAVWCAICQVGLLAGIEGVFLASFASTPEFSEAYKNPSAAIWGAATAMYPVFAALGSLAVLWLSSVMAAKTMLALGVYVWLIGCLVAVLVPNLAALVAGRILKGFSIGILFAVLPLYVDRIVDRKSAAKILTAMQATGPLGTLFAALVGNLREWHGDFAHGWLLMAAPVFPLALLILYIPREPAETVSNETIILPISYQLRQGLFGSKIGHVGTDIRLLWRTHRYFVRVAGACAAQIGWQLTGINILIYFSFEMCLLMGLGPRLAAQIALGLYAANFAGTAVSLVFINKLPRRRTLQGSVFAMSITHGAIYLALLTGSTKLANGAGAVACCFLFVLLFSTFFAGMSLVYTSEVVPTKARSTSIGVATASGWFANFAISLVAPILIQHISYHIFLVLCWSCAILFVFFIVLL